MSTTDNPNEEITYHDEYTLVRVQEALLAVGIDLDTAVGAISEMQNRGIYFRERQHLDTTPHAEHRPTSYQRCAEPGCPYVVAQGGSICGRH